MTLTRDHPASAPERRALILVENLSVPADPRVWKESLSLRRAGWEVVVVCPRGTGDEDAPLDNRDGVEIHRYKPYPSGGGLIGYAREYSAAAGKIWWRVRRLASVRRFDIVHACNPPDLLLPLALGVRRRGAALVFDHHDLVPELYESRFGGRGFTYGVARSLERLTFRLADVVISTNESYRRIAIDRGGKQPEDVFVVRNGPDPDVFVPGKPAPILKRGKPFLLAYLGLMGPQDGVDFALRALSSLRTTRKDWFAVFAGDGDALPSLRRLASELELEDLVDFPGRIGTQEIIDLLSTADVCLAPEPFSPLNDLSTMVKIGEYMSFARPIAAFDLTESRYTAGGAAIYAKPNDEAQLAANIDRLLNDDAKRAEMGRFGRARIMEEFSWAHSEQALLAAYDRAVAVRTSDITGL